MIQLFFNLQKTSLQDDLINRVVLYLLEDDDIRVRQASAKCLARYGHTYIHALVNTRSYDNFSPFNARSFLFSTVPITVSA